ncbi:hypothetical protein VNO78_14857 [Psophocarpus tetragonolobus]|uniref:Uncharacterized protein n=1 Tax=Psophocarpus tetragonolobus TaxID=3891 RepID=A0AAN9XJ76_PSOTE
MDSFKQIWGSAEGCSSSESGWTMYIASPMQEDDAGCSNENDGYHIYGENRRKKQGVKVDEEESDDSMASDASSGPVHYHHDYAHSQSTHGTASKKDKQDHGSKCSSKKNANKQEKKRVDSRTRMGYAALERGHHELGPFCIKQKARSAKIQQSCWKTNTKQFSWK